MSDENPMREVRIGAVVLNIGVGESGDKLGRAEKLLEILTNKKPVRTISKHKIPAWNLKKREPIGVKVTLRKDDAAQVLKRCLVAVDHKVKPSCFDKYGNFSFGVPEYIDIPGMKYDTEIGVFGMNICCTLERAGYRVKRRKIKASKMSKNHRVGKEESINFIKQNFNVAVEGEQK